VTTKNPLILLLSGLLAYTLIIGPFTSTMNNKTIVEKLGYVPSTTLLKPLSADQKEIVAASLVMKVLMYFGGAVEPIQNKKTISEPLDLQGMSRLLHGAVKLDPYNMDAYYFAQAFLTWDAKQFSIANELLEYGMGFRTWDWYLPFFAGFNHAYFLKDFQKASIFYKRAAELSGQDLHKRLAGRYLQESGQTELAIVYMTTVIESQKNPTLKKMYETRLLAFQEIFKIEQARDVFQAERDRLPTTVKQLYEFGYLKSLPKDPYGGEFFIDQSGKVLTTSKFAFATKNK